MEWHKDNFLITDDTARADIDYITASLNTTYWAEGRPRKIVERSIQNSIVLSLFDGDGRQIGLTRIVTDTITFAWICDVYVDPAYRGQGLGKWLMECTMAHPACNTRLRILATRDAHGLYERYGFETGECMWARRGNEFFESYE
jgi:GNAT superfamily N-acetyltransferase